MGSLVPYDHGELEPVRPEGGFGRWAARRFGEPSAKREPLLEIGESTERPIPLWESLPDEVRWKLDGRDPDKGPVIVSFARRPEVVGAGRDFREVTSGWRLHESSVFAAAATRPLARVRGRARAAGEWVVDSRSVGAEQFRLKAGTFPSRTDRSPGGGDHHRNEGEVWAALPNAVRELLGTTGSLSASNDYRDRWLVEDKSGARSWLCFERRESTRLRAAILSCAVAGEHAVPDAPLDRLPPSTVWETKAFSAELDESFAALLPPALTQLGGGNKRRSLR